MARKVVCKWALMLLLCLGLPACKAPPPAPVISRQPPPSERIDYHLVSKGDTLYSIAWRYELDVQQLAAANGLLPPYTIHVGQRLTLDTRTVVATSRTRPKTGTVAPPTVVPQPSSPAKTPASRPAAKPTLASKPAAQPSPQPGYQMPAPGQWRWQWPARGKISRHYDSNREFKGINIQAKPGQAVEAAAPGVVVYAGNGLRGYGQLIIIKHSDVYLSAYAQNRRMFVKEGQTIRPGQKISEVGGDPANRGRLYFEIRQNGKPVDPLRLLP